MRGELAPYVQAVLWDPLRMTDLVASNAHNLMACRLSLRDEIKSYRNMQ